MTLDDLTIAGRDMASLLCLGDDLLLQILSLLDAEELVSLRTTCKYLCALSKTRYLWNGLLRRDVVGQGTALPHYRKRQCELGARELESLTRRALRAGSLAQTAATVTRLDQGRSVNFVRLIHGQYLLAALTKAGVESTLVLYSLLAVQRGELAPLAQATLPGPVSSGEVEVQEGEVVIALCFQSPQRMVTVVSLRQTAESAMVFNERARFDGCSHIRTLQGPLVGCAVQGDANASLPCLLNWQTGAVQTLPPSPESDGRCVAMALRGDLCVVARSNVLSVYSLAAPHPQLVQDLRFDHALGSVAVAAAPLHAPAGAPGPAPLHLLITSHSGLHVYTVSEHAPGAFVSELVAEEALKQSTVLTASPGLPRLGASASHVAWTNTPASFFDRSARIMVGRIARSSDGAPGKIELLSECKDWRLPSLSAMPVMDFDDGMGILAVGNALGELAICNYAGPLSPTLVSCLRPLPVPAA